MSKKKKKHNNNQIKEPLIQNKRIRNALIRVGIAAVIAFTLLYLSGISLLTLFIGARSVETREDMSKSTIQELTGTVVDVFRETEAGYWTAVECSDGIIAVFFKEKPVTGDLVTATGFVQVLNDLDRQELLAWYDQNGDFAGGEEYFDNVSPLYIHDGYGRFFPISTAKAISAVTMLFGAYTILVYIGISTGKYGENK